MIVERELLTKITVRGDALTETIPTDVIYKGIVWGLIGVVWDSENAEFVCTYEKTDTEPADPIDTVQEIDNMLYFLYGD